MPDLPPLDDAPTLRYDPELGPGYFVQTRADFLRHPEFSPLATRLYQVLLTYCGAGETAWPGQARLVRECGIKSVPTLRKALDELIEADLITETRRGLNRTNLYHVHKLPLHLTQDTKKIAIQKQRNAGSRTARIRLKVESDQTHTAETDRPRNLPNEQAALEGALRYTKQNVVAGVAAWHADGCPPWQSWLQTRGGT
jgi:hypothetical protein